jgi:hypothetical protein
VSRERGIALPLAVVILFIAVSLTLVLGALSVTEPVIASNHLLAAQARVAAESGLEAAIAAFSNTPTLSTMFAATMGAAPFTLLPGTSAGYRIAVSVDPTWTTFEKANQRRIAVAGIAASGEAAEPDTAPNRALTTIEAIIRRDSLLNTLLFPAAITLPAGAILKGEVDARPQTAWCRRHGSAIAPLAGAAVDSARGLSNSGAVWGPGDDAANENGRDILPRPSSDFLFANQTFTVDELAALKALALSTGTFYRGRPVTFDGRAPLPGAQVVLYVEGDVEIEAYGDDTTWTGWIVAVGPHGVGSGGRIAFRCFSPCASTRQQLTINGLLYAEEHLEVSTPDARRSVTINGGVVTRNLDGTASSIDPHTRADFRINLRCQGDGGAARGARDALEGTPETIGPFDPDRRSGWYVKAGSVREIAAPP